MLSDDVGFKDLGLVIIDEEQRFGVAHKEQLKRWRTEVDVLTMTATPIPRTLYMSLTGVRDISIINTAPSERLPVQTYVGAADEARLKRAILRELERGGQVFMVHNRVETIEIIRKQIAKLVPEAVCAVGHGQMSERQLEQIMLDFAEGKVDILISTTIIESGLDFPNANTLIVDRAEMFGLSQLYQLRGRTAGYNTSGLASTQPASVPAHYRPGGTSDYEGPGSSSHVNIAARQDAQETAAPSTSSSAPDAPTYRYGAEPPYGDSGIGQRY
jgi:transcription-repair coupling factor (superfamily II helicase)